MTAIDRPSVVRQLSIELFIVLVIGFGFALIGPFGSYALPLGWRLAYWMGFGLIGYALFRPLNLVAEWTAELSGAPRWLAVGLSGLIAGFPMTILIGIVLNGFRFDASVLGDGFLTLYAQVVGIGLAIYGTSYFVFTREYAEEPLEAPTEPASSAPTGVSATALHDKLPPGFPPIIALSVEDHYVKVHAEGRSEMLLMNLSEAITMMRPDDGLQVHRSWWVARNAVQSSEREGRNIR